MKKRNNTPAGEKENAKSLLEWEKCEPVQEILRKSTVNLKDSLYEKIKRSSFLGKNDEPESNPKKRLFATKFFKKKIRDETIGWEKLAHQDAKDLDVLECYN